MHLITAQLKLIMLITGALTCTMAYALVAPQAALLSMFGEALPDSPLMHIVVRSWGMLITLLGAALIYGAFNPAVRPLVLTLAGLSKLVFVGLLILLGGQYLPQTLTPIVVDSLAVILYAICLPRARREAAAV
ncbi:hypothetical protein HNE05_11765 [Aquipseudomonas campi]|uniref:DUF4345 domain-containing protein n=1 Tax=Aquipseudomonas campi TaxID=2731681 RepID=A0A6M8FJE6_9GAMM|nr:hypothetical protein [Pseudomonas campi]QKE63999.1 hypothetical protein HNE05_11765 [Pseudomonas campi]